MTTLIRFTAVSCIALASFFGIRYTETTSDTPATTPAAGRESVHGREARPRRMTQGYPYQAAEWQHRLRAHPVGSIPVEWRKKAEQAMNAAAAASKSSSLPGQPGSPGLSSPPGTQVLAWESLGPNNVGGRIRSIAIDPNNTSILYCGSVSGGVFKSTNAGTSWFPTTDQALNLAVTSIVIDPSNSNVVYAGTGEGFYNIDALRGEGVLKTTDGGSTWTMLQNFAGSPRGFPHYINDLYIRSDNVNILYAAANEGVFRTTNGGAGWTYIKRGDRDYAATSIVGDYTNPQIIYVAFGNFVRDGIYKTTDGGGAWSKLAGGLPTSGYYRINLGISRNTPTTIYASLCDSISFGTHSIQKSTDAGASWTTMTEPSDNMYPSHLGFQGWYNNVISVHPTNASTVFAGGIHTHRSTTGGLTWTQINSGYPPSALPFMHVDQHAVVFDPVNPTIMYFGNDGGVYRSTNGGSALQDRNNGLVTAQFYSGAIHPSATTFYGGTQDNGTLKSATLPAWTQALGGDGGATAVDYTTPTTVYTEYVWLNFQKSTNSGTSWSRSMSGIPTSGGAQSDGTSDRCAFIAPFVMDPTNSQILYAGTYRLFRTTNGASTWATVSNDLTGDGAGTVGSQESVISAIGVSASAPGTIYVGTTGGDSASRVMVTTNTGTTWTNVTKLPLPNRAVTSIAVAPANPLRAYVGYSGYDANTPLAPGHIFRTANRGGTWANISGDLPDIPVNAIYVDPGDVANHLIVGTDMGVFETTNGGMNWIERNVNMARVSVADLDLRPDGILYAATHGRGMFRSTEPVVTDADVEGPGVPVAHALHQNYPNPFNPSTTIAFEAASSAEGKLIVYDAAGREVAVLFDGQVNPGRHELTFDASGLASGVYFYRLHLSGGEGFTLTRKMLLIR